MVLSWLSKLVASILVSVLFGTIFTVVLDQTVLNSHYLEGQLTTTNSYAGLSNALSDQVVRDAGQQNQPLATVVVQGILSPAVLKTKIDSALDQLQAYYKGDSPAPVVDLTDLAAQAQTLGIPISSDSGLTKPITLGSNDKAKNVGKVFKDVKLSAIITCLMLTALLVLICWKRRKYVALPGVLIGTGILVGLLALVLTFAPGLLNHYIAAKLDTNAFAAVGQNLATAISHDLGKRFGVIAAVCLVIGIGVRVSLSRLKPRTETVSVSPPSSGSMSAPGGPTLTQ